MINNSTKNNNIQLFNFNQSEINTIITDDNVLFDANQVCSILEFKNPRTALKNHCFEDDVLKQDTIDRLGRSQQKSYVNESGLYCLIFGSKKPSALAFKNPRTALQNHCFEADVLKQDTLTKGGIQQKSYVNESGLYHAIFKSHTSSTASDKQ
jgi:prophage antirepressor-like protein